MRLPPAPRWSAYLSSKAAFDVWLGCAAPELRSSGIATTSVDLGLVHTRMSAPTPTLRRHALARLLDEAARVLCRALIRRPRRCGPWWLLPVGWLAWPLATPLEWVHRWLFKRGKDSPAALGSGDDRAASPGSGIFFAPFGASGLYCFGPACPSPFCGPGGDVEARTPAC